MTATVAVDVGGTQMRVALVDEDGNLTHRALHATAHGDEVPGALIAMMRDAVAAGGTAAVVGLPGPVDYQQGALLWAPHLPQSWYAALSETSLGEALGVPVQLANDADLATVGEAELGAGRGYRDVAYVTVSTGFGAGVVSGGRLLAGIRSLGEVGHTVIDLPAFAQGRPATLEELASGSGLVRLAREAGLGDIDGSEVERRTLTGDDDAARVWHTAVQAAAVGVANLAWSFAPEVVVVGGGVGRRPGFFRDLVTDLRAHVQPGQPDPALVVAEFDDDSGLVGAARWTQAMAPRTEDSTR